MGRPLKYTLLWIISSILLVSCSVPIANISEQYRLKDNRGVVLLSLTASGECGFVFFTEIRELGSGSAYSIGMQDFGRERDWVKNDSKCPSTPDNYFGKLVVIELPAGEYEIYQLEGLSKYEKIYAERELSIKFTVVPAKVNYLGNLHYHIKKKNFIYGVKNMMQRDIPLLISKYGQFDSQDIIVNLLRMRKVKVMTAQSRT